MSLDQITKLGSSKSTYIPLCKGGLPSALTSSFRRKPEPRAPGPQSPIRKLLAVPPLAARSLVDQRVRLEGCPGEPQMVGVNDGCQLLAGGRSLDSLTQ